MRRGIVSVGGERVGALEETPGGTSFSYDLGARHAVSVTMPIRTEPYVSSGLSPWFENLLPEGWLLDLATTGLKIPRDDAFGLLLAVGADCIGAVEIHPETR